jgi:coenzyme F420-0:L-glutamate ligase/coenzyme F420-1:gamma-L-glutamate ligase
MAMQLTVTGVEGVPPVHRGDDLAALLISAIEAQGLQPANDDIFVIAQKVVSKAEGRLLNLASVDPSPEALKLARETDKDPSYVEAILRQSSEVVRAKPGVIVVAHRLGHVLANAGIDRSNVEGAEEGNTVLLLPEDPDASAAHLKARFDARWNVNVGVIIADSVGRAWRLGTVGIAIGTAGVAALNDSRGEPDMFGRALEVTVTGHADAIAAAATLVMGEGEEAIPSALVRGVERGEAMPASSINRPKSEDMFR